MHQKTRIVIADDHKLVRQTISSALNEIPEFLVVGQANNGKELLDLLPEAKPELIILDLNMPVMNGWQVLDKLEVELPNIKVVILSMLLGELRLSDLVAKGVRGFIPKNSDFESLINAIKDVAAVGYYFSPKIGKSIVSELLSSRAIKPKFPQVKLNEKEYDTLLLICQDKLTKTIASELGLSERTVERYKTGLYEKIGANTTAGLVLFALKNNLYSLSDQA